MAISHIGSKYEFHAVVCALDADSDDEAPPQPIEKLVDVPNFIPQGASTKPRKRMMMTSDLNSTPNNAREWETGLDSLSVTVVSGNNVAYTQLDTDQGHRRNLSLTERILNILPGH
ncbi:unnamed protein product [Umbelopsis vinacea]